MPALTSPNSSSQSDLARDAATKDSAEVLRLLGTSPAGLTEEEAAARLEQYGPNEVGREKHEGWLQRLYIAARNPLVILLTILAIISFVAPQGDARAGVVMLLMVVLGSVSAVRPGNPGRHGRRQTQSDDQRHRHRGARRPGQGNPLQQLVPGDVVKLSAGDMIPGDVRLLSAKDLFVIQATLTGESMPVEKTDARDLRGERVRHRTHEPLLPGHQRRERLGHGGDCRHRRADLFRQGGQEPRRPAGRDGLRPRREAVHLADDPVHGWSWCRWSSSSTALTKHDWKEAFFFSLAVAVGLTPEMLPMIVSVCLSKGALAMSRKKVIVKRLNSIQNFGAMDVLCTDKTGTLTMDHVILEIYCDVFKKREARRCCGTPTSSATSRPASRTCSTAPCCSTRSCTSELSHRASTARWTKSPSTSPAG